MNRIQILHTAREAAERLGSETTYDAIVTAIKEYKGRDKIGFALCLTSYLNDRRVRMPILDEYKYARLNMKIVKTWKATR